eukprot:GILI01023315.1.p1 GENE.GILI01023315.1~~GILI01023315.1.p1  ORF type:complete len:180 (-),score=10.64 GILI01023315.1:70-609(-)
MKSHASAGKMNANGNMILGGLVSRERLNTVYYAIFTPCMNNVIIVVSIFLLLVSFLHRSSLGDFWFHFTEGAITLLFTSEVIIRLLVMRSGFWDNAINVAEATACLFCVVVFSLLSFASHTTRMEHNLLILLRLAAQALRVVGVIKGGSSASVAESSNFNVYAVGGGLGGGSGRELEVV